MSENWWERWWGVRFLVGKGASPPDLKALKGFCEAVALSCGEIPQAPVFPVTFELLFPGSDPGYWGWIAELERRGLLSEFMVLMDASCQVQRPRMWRLQEGEDPLTLAKVLGREFTTTTALGGPPSREVLEQGTMLSAEVFDGEDYTDESALVQALESRMQRTPFSSFLLASVHCSFSVAERYFRILDDFLDAPRFLDMCIYFSPHISDVDGPGRFLLLMVSGPVPDAAMLDGDVTLAAPDPSDD